MNAHTPLSSHADDTGPVFPDPRPVIPADVCALVRAVSDGRPDPIGAATMLSWFHRWRTRRRWRKMTKAIGAAVHREADQLVIMLRQCPEQWHGIILDDPAWLQTDEGQRAVGFFVNECFARVEAGAAVAYD